MKRNENWWRSAVIYQIYPRSFKDSNGDGIGDLRGIIEKLDYLERLGINAIWLSPVYKSPQDDNGYDISDYCDIDSMFGSMDDMEELIREADKRNIGIIMDMVLNHSSDEHPWFIEAKKGRDNPYHDYYVWVDGEEGTPPNNLRACFGGSAWEWVPEVSQYYLHQYSVKQPDLNWENEKVRRELYDMLNWWIGKGAAGFRFDVIDVIAKEPLKGITANGSRLHEFIREMNKETFGGKNLLTVGETWGATPEIAKVYSNPDGSEFSMVFQFEHMSVDEQPGKAKWDLAPFDFIKLKRVLAKWQTELKNEGWNSLFWDNHDLPRIVSRFGDDKEYREESAKMLATLLHCMKGTPYIYQGEELGMTNVRFDDISEYRDIEIINMYNERLAAGVPRDEIMRSIYAKGRDNARTPMQWSDAENAGFTTGIPWIGINENYTKINAEAEMARENGIFNYYRKLIEMRKQHRIIVEGDFRLLCGDDEKIFAYERRLGNEILTVICNFAAEKTRYPDGLPEGALLLSNYNEISDAGLLRPYEARVYVRA